MKQLDMLYEGKAKKVYKTDDEDHYIVHYKDDATALNGAKKGTIYDKGVFNNKITSFFFTLLKKNGIDNHLEKMINDRDQIVKKLQMLPLEVIVRNVVAGSMAKRLGREEGEVLIRPTVEFSLKSDPLDDPWINEYYAVSLGLATEEQVKEVIRQAFAVNDVLKPFLADKGVVLVDFKLEFGLFHGQVMLGDEISPDTCRFWDADTHEHLDKDRFRRDLGDVDGGYKEMLKRLTGEVL